VRADRVEALLVEVGGDLVRRRSRIAAGRPSVMKAVQPRMAAIRRPNASVGARRPSLPDRRPVRDATRGGRAVGRRARRVGRALVGEGPLPAAVTR
jgi:hypothetical protein